MIQNCGTLHQTHQPRLPQRKKYYFTDWSQVQSNRFENYVAAILLRMAQLYSDRFGEGVPCLMVTLKPDFYREITGNLGQKFFKFHGPIW